MQRRIIHYSRVITYEDAIKMFRKKRGNSNVSSFLKNFFLIRIQTRSGKFLYSRSKKNTRLRNGRPDDNGRGCGRGRRNAADPCRFSGSFAKRRPCSGGSVVNYFGWSLILSRYAMPRRERGG